MEYALKYNENIFKILKKEQKNRKNMRKCILIVYKLFLIHWNWLHPLNIYEFTY